MKKNVLQKVTRAANALNNISKIDEYKTVNLLIKDLIGYDIDQLERIRDLAYWALEERSQYGTMIEFENKICIRDEK